MIILGIETSCDDTAAAVVGSEGTVYSSCRASDLGIHSSFGGVVPEIASRQHLSNLLPVVSLALRESGLEPKDMQAIAGTYGPGLAGSLLVGLSAAKALAWAWELPFVGVNHLEGHLAATFLEESSVSLPLVALLVSGAHTLLVEVRRPGEYRLLGQTRDDAAGEAYDKVARMLGFGYPGGPHIDEAAKLGDPKAFLLPRAMRDFPFEFSFSGLKNAVRLTLQSQPHADVADLSASFQAAVVDTLTSKLDAAIREVGAKSVAIGGGVAANSALRGAVKQLGVTHEIASYVPSLAYCTDNAAMIAFAGSWHVNEHGDGSSSLDLGVAPRLPLA